MIRLLAVIERDLKKFRRNPFTLMMSILLPMLYLFVLGNSFQGELKGLPLVVVKMDSGSFARQLMDNLRAIEAGPKTLKIYSSENEKEALDDVNKGIYKAALIIPPDFSKKIDLKKSPELGIFLDNTDVISSKTLRNTVMGAVEAIYTDYVAIRERLDQVHLRDISLFQKVDYFQSLVPGVVIMAIFMGTLTTGAFSLVMDRFLGVDESYLLTPLSRWDIVGGLVLSGLGVTTVIAFLILAVSMAVTGIPMKIGIQNFLSILLLVILTTLSLMSLMFVILSQFDHPRIVGIISGFLNVILFFPSGAIYPIAGFPPWLRSFAKINPEAYSVSALKAILFKEGDLDTIMQEIIFLFLFSIVMMTVALVTFKRTL